MIPRHLLTASVAVLLLPLSAAAQDRADPIDRRLAACLDGAEAASTAGQHDCMTRAYDAWDRELNKAYGDLMRRAGQAEAGKLRDAQRRWIAYRDAERAYHELHYSMEATGTLGGIAAHGAMVEVVRARTLLLRNYATGPCGTGDC